ncbi:hypothetical protein IQ255_29340 [Pleurocapsales cyanobacterium LEGE 10410]|nr:hypothetical protein [Pleurocapsales cyanobacterium LEGE 10410]
MKKYIITYLSVIFFSFGLSYFQLESSIVYANTACHNKECPSDGMSGEDNCVATDRETNCGVVVGSNKCLHTIDCDDVGESG